MFDVILRDLSARAGAEGAIMIDRDGEIVASWSGTPSLAMDLIGAHHGIIFDIVKDAATSHGARTVESVAITTDRARLAIHTIKEGYLLVLALRRESPVGKALLESKAAVMRIEEEMR